jgi:hypothetical protein
MGIFLGRLTNHAFDKQLETNKSRNNLSNSDVDSDVLGELIKEVNTGKRKC